MFRRGGGAAIAGSKVHDRDIDVHNLCLYVRDLWWRPSFHQLILTAQMATGTEKHQFPGWVTTTFRFLAGGFHPHPTPTDAWGTYKWPWKQDVPFNYSWYSCWCFTYQWHKLEVAPVSRDILAYITQTDVINYHLYAVGAINLEILMGIQCEGSNYHNGTWESFMPKHNPLIIPQDIKQASSERSPQQKYSILKKNVFQGANQSVGIILCGRSYGWMVHLWCNHIKNALSICPLPVLATLRKYVKKLILNNSS